MGVCESENNTKYLKTQEDKLKLKEFDIENESTNESLQSRRNKYYRIKPCSTNPEVETRFLQRVHKSICRIKIETIYGTIRGFGFLLSIWIEQERFYCFAANEHIIRKEFLYKDINVELWNDNKLRFTPEIINLKNEKRYMRSFADIGLDLTIIEILDKDIHIINEGFLDPEPEELVNYELNDDLNYPIFLPTYPVTKKFLEARGRIAEVDKFGFKYQFQDDYGQPGCPVFLKLRVHVVAINTNDRYANFIYPAVNIVKDDIRKIRNTGKYVDGKYVWADNKYYVGEFKNNIPNGKGIKYYPNGNLLYEGDFVNGKFDGVGKYHYDDGDIFVGDYKQGLRNGKGTLYYKDGNIRYEGDYINDKKNGKGKYIWENGDYYIGDFENDLFHGKGVHYYANGQLRYDGQYIHDKRDGIGKYVYRNKEYYVGGWKRGFKHGIGVYYYPDGKLKYQGEFFNDRAQGNGMYIYENREYYIGEFKNTASQGYGIEYYADDGIRYEGEWDEDSYKGKGKNREKNIYPDDPYNTYPKNDVNNVAKYDRNTRDYRNNTNNKGY